MNALNTVWDLLLVKPYRDGGPAVNAWDIQGLRTAIAVNGTLNDPTDKDKAWTVEMALPWAVLRECLPATSPRPAPGDQWRVNFSRVEYRVDDGERRLCQGQGPGDGKPLPRGQLDLDAAGPHQHPLSRRCGATSSSTDKVAGKGKEMFDRRPRSR